MNTQENTFLALGRTGRFHWIYYAISFFGLLLICLSVSLFYIPLDSKISEIQSKNAILAIQLSSFAYILILFLLLVSYIHKRPILSFVSSANKFGLKKMIGAFILFILVNSLVELFNCFIIGQSYSFQFEYFNFILLVVIALSLLVIQSATEEIILRGYLLQALSSFSYISPVAALFISSLFFACLHISNPEFNEYGFIQMFTAYFIIAIFLGAFAILGKGLEIPIGIHAANNFYAAVIVNYKSSALKSESLFMLDEINIPLGLIEYILILMIFIVIFYKLNWIDHPKNLI